MHWSSSSAKNKKVRRYCTSNGVVCFDVIHLPYQLLNWVSPRMPLACDLSEKKKFKFAPSLTTLSLVLHELMWPAAILLCKETTGCAPSTKKGLSEQCQRKTISFIDSSSRFTIPDINAIYYTYCPPDLHFLYFFLFCSLIDHLHRR